MNQSHIKVWGPCAWNTLHVTSFNYPQTPTDDQKIDMYNYLTSFSKIIPCMICRNDFTKMLNDYLQNDQSMHLNSGHNLSTFIVFLHNKVNEKLNKPTKTYDEIKRMYIGRPSQYNVSLICILIILIIIVGVGFSVKILKSIRSILKKKRKVN